MDIRYFEAMQDVGKQYAHQLEPVCRQWKVTGNELAVLLFLANNPGYDRAADIVERRGMTKSHVSLSVGTLEHRGLLRRRREQRDHRQIHLELTEAGWEIARCGQGAQKQFFSAVFQGITRQELENWYGILQRMWENMQDMKADKER